MIWGAVAVATWRLRPRDRELFVFSPGPEAVLRKSLYSQIADHRCLYGAIANTRAGKPDPPFGLGKLTTTRAPASGT